MEFLTPSSEAEFEAYFETRWLLLREPLGFPRGSERDESESESYHIMAKANNKVVGVGRLTVMPGGQAQVRYMGVDEAYRSSGVGKEILNRLENEARTKKVKTIFLNARIDAVGFYKKQGYKEEGETFASVGGIIHRKMVKSL